ncbi:hypothetical protein FLP10_00520 [Agromyces intestinalis]|uniref:DUF559 domain-containing protein n=1 Tax=Agromyces intestinalis TaxID=2592652 RepID=A0A5C1YAU7_9MICO|nr:hypothetical protein [Agromyces intestinalis]QEO13066.1 hypothetical protein FLP10_00520 [Agromyces intestinalis]
MVAVRFACGHGAGAGGSVTISRDCPVCRLIDETQRSRGELLGRVAPAQRARLAVETRVGAEYEWRCARGHDRYAATVVEQLTGTGCAKCRAAAEAPAAVREAGLAFIDHGLRTRTSATEHRLRTLLDQRIRLPHRVNAVHIRRTFHGRTVVWPDILVPALRVAIEYDDPGRGGRSHRGLREASDLEKDAALREVGWEVIRVRGGGLGPLGRYSIVCTSITHHVADAVLAHLRDIRGVEAVAAIARTEPESTANPVPRGVRPLG